MNEVYRHKTLAPDEFLGHVEANGKVYESRFGPDRYIGRVDIGDGTIYESRLGPDKPIGRVELDSGKVYLSKLGPMSIWKVVLRWWLYNINACRTIVRQGEGHTSYDTAGQFSAADHPGLRKMKPQRCCWCQRRIEPGHWPPRDLRSL
jgi:hypothetical protein